MAAKTKSQALRKTTKMATPPTTPPSVQERYAHLEGQVSESRSELRAFFDESKDQIKQIWQAIREQGSTFVASQERAQARAEEQNAKQQQQMLAQDAKFLARHEEQGRQFQTVIDQLKDNVSKKGQITLGSLSTAIGLMISLITAGALISNAIIGGKVELLKAADECQTKANAAAWAAHEKEDALRNQLLEEKLERVRDKLPK